MVIQPHLTSTPHTTIFDGQLPNKAVLQNLFAMTILFAMPDIILHFYSQLAMLLILEFSLKMLKITPK
jgi:hypothetical protein